jgi:DNA adenine methylase
MSLATAEICVSDFRDVLDSAKAGDFVFFDPPYPRGSARSTTGFNRYASEFFEEDDHEELAELVEELTETGVHVMVTLPNLTRYHSLYPADLPRTLIRSKSLIACNGHDRRGVGELVLTNYSRNG